MVLQDLEFKGRISILCHEKSRWQKIRGLGVTNNKVFTCFLFRWLQRMFWSHDLPFAFVHGGYTLRRTNEDLLMCTCVHMHVCKRVCMCMCTCVRVKSEVNLRCPLWDSVSLWAWNPSFQTAWLTFVPEANCPQLQMDTVTPAFYMGAGDLNSALQACVTGSLAQNHHLRPQWLTFYVAEHTSLF